MEELTPERIAADGAAYLDYLQRVAASDPVGITGYCMGARVGLRIAAAHPDRVAALAGFHAGGLVSDAPDSPHRSAGDTMADTAAYDEAARERHFRELRALLERALTS